jgi:trehalose/maltose hydrolase-like predicted phosphorylase
MSYQSMDGEAHNSQITQIADLLIKDKISLDEQDQIKLQKYLVLAKSKFNLSDDDSSQLVNEALLYLKLKSANDYDPLQEADKFGAGFS